MSTVTLLTKAYNNFQLKLGKFLKSTLKGLDAEIDVCGVTPRGRVQITVSGEDEKVALHYLTNEIGLCPTHLEDVERFLVIKGYITAVEKSKRELYVDIGVFLPNIIDAAIPLQHLQAQLVDGRKVALREILDLFGFCENLPLTIKISHVTKEKNCIEAILSEKQLIQYKNWMKSLLDRLVILGASFSEIRWALKTAGCDRDIVRIESLGLFEYAVVCKLGTDAAGLIPKIGKSLRNAMFTVFNPEKVLEFLDYSTLVTK